MPQTWLSVSFKKQTDVTACKSAYLRQMQHFVRVATCMQGPTALHEAAEKCDEAMVNLLLEHGANIKARTKYVCLQPLRQTVHCVPDAALTCITNGTTVLAVVSQGIAAMLLLLAELLGAADQGCLEQPGPLCSEQGPSPPPT